MTWKRLSDEQGVALFMVLWVMAFLVVLVMEFSLLMRTEVEMTDNLKQETQAYYLAKAGFNMAVVEITQPSENQFSLTDGDIMFTTTEDGGRTPGDRDYWAEKAKQREQISMKTGFVTYRIFDEDGKININIADKDELQRLLSICGIETGSRQDEIIYSIIDWRDRDHDKQIAGAEDDYYNGLEEPYGCKDGNFDTIEELQLVKGVTKEIYHGDAQSRLKGLKNFITVHSQGFNKNTASPEALYAKLGESEVNDVINKRKETLFTGAEGRSNTFTIISTGQIKDSPVKRSIKAVVRRRGANPKILLWNDDYLDEELISFEELL